MPDEGNVFSISKTGVRGWSFSSKIEELDLEFMKSFDTTQFVNAVQSCGNVLSLSELRRDDFETPASAFQKVLENARAFLDVLRRAPSNEEGQIVLRGARNGTAQVRFMGVYCSLSFAVLYGGLPLELLRIQQDLGRHVGVPLRDGTLNAMHVLVMEKIIERIENAMKGYNAAPVVNDAAPPMKNEATMDTATASLSLLQREILQALAGKCLTRADLSKAATAAVGPSGAFNRALADLRKRGFIRDASTEDRRQFADPPQRGGLYRLDAPPPHRNGAQ